jgi:ABC-2 type transport system permease protein
MIRRHRVLMTSWSVLLIALAGATVSAYQSTYPTPEQRRVAVELAQHNAATILLYGNLPDPGTPAQMFAWEIGAIATILAAIMAVLVAIALTRAAEDDGTLELVRCCGAGPRAPLRSALAILALVAAILTLGCTVAAGLNAGRVDAVTWPGAAAFGSVVGLTFLLVAVLAVALAQIVPTAGGARILGFAAVGAAFGVRSIADTQHVGWLNWLSPLGLRATVRPFTGNRWWALAAYLTLAVVLAWLATVLHDRREYRAGLIRQCNLHDTHLNIHSSLGLAARLARQPVLTWTIAVAAIGTLFSAMGSGVVKQSQGGDVGGFLGAQLGAGDPVAGYFAYSGTIVGMVAASFAVLSVLRGRHDETGGLTDHVLAAGIRRWAPLAAQVAVTALGTAAVLVATGALSALVAPLVIDGTDIAGRSFGYVAGQWPSAMAMAGWTALLVGRWPRLSWLAWVPLVASATLALLGQLLGVPRSVRDLGIFQHVPDIATPSPNIQGLLILLAFATAATLLGVAGITRRDIITG